MLRYVVHRLLLMIPTLIAISIIVFVIIQLPPGNYLESYIAELQAQGESVDPQKIAFLREYYGLDKPLRRAVPALGRAACSSATSATRSNSTCR